MYRNTMEFCRYGTVLSLCSYEYSVSVRSGFAPPCVLLQYRSYHEVLKFIRIVTANYSMNRLT